MCRLFVDQLEFGNILVCLEHILNSTIYACSYILLKFKSLCMYVCMYAQILLEKI